jgi:hypothetical protein
MFRNQPRLQVKAGVLKLKTLENDMGRLGVFLLGAAAGIVGVFTAAVISDKVSSSRQAISSASGELDLEENSQIDACSNDNGEASGQPAVSSDPDDATVTV